jgi:leader peptidase (prepilin peptidase)/N-methyltransferase
VDQADADSFRTLFLAWSACLGAVVGSFLNVVVARLPAGQSVVHPRSRCPRCQRPIAWYDNVPVLSWLLLRARCRHCRLPISARYPLVEALVAALAAWVASRHGPTAAALLELTLVALLVALAFIDLDTWLLPWALTIPFAVLGLGGGALGLTPAGSIGAAGLGGALGFGLFLAIHLVGEKVLHKEALGFGDVVLLGGIGAWLGPRGLLPVILLSSLQGAAVGIALLALGKGEPGPQEPTATSTSTEAPSPPQGGGEGVVGSPTSQAPSVSPTGGGEVVELGATPTSQSRSLSPTGGEGRGEGAAEADDDWVPPRHAIPYGPFLVLAALEWLFLGTALGRLVPALSVFLP